MSAAGPGRREKRRAAASSGSLVGSISLLYLLGYNTSIAVWVGMIALMGLDAETGVFMLLFLDLAFDARVRHGRMQTRAARLSGGLFDLEGPFAAAVSSRFTAAKRLECGEQSPLSLRRRAPDDGCRYPAALARRVQRLGCRCTSAPRSL